MPTLCGTLQTAFLLRWSGIELQFRRNSGIDEAVEIARMLASGDVLSMSTTCQIEPGAGVPAGHSDGV